MAGETPSSSLIEQARSGDLTVSFSNRVVVDADEFVYIERDCQAFKDRIRTLQTIAQRLADRENWGLGESNPRLKSAQTVVGSYRAKAGSSAGELFDTNVYDILQQHYQIVDDIQILHRTIAQKYRDQDAAFAAEYDRLSANLPVSPIGTAQGPPTPGGVTVGIGQA